MTSAEDICNLALVKLGSEFEVSNITTPANARDRLFKLLYPVQRDSELRKRRWRFALSYTVLTALLDVDDAIVVGLDPDFPYSFDLPDDCLRPLKPPNSGSTRWPVNWTSRGGRLLADESGDIGLHYIARTEPAAFDPNFVDALACKLAFEACEKITQSNQKKADLDAQYKDSIAVARQMNAFEVVDETYDTNDFDIPFIAGRL